MPAEKPTTNQDIENLGKSISSGLSGISKILNKNREKGDSNTKSVIAVSYTHLTLPTKRIV